MSVAKLRRKKQSNQENERIKLGLKKNYKDDFNVATTIGDKTKDIVSHKKIPDNKNQD